MKKFILLSVMALGAMTMSAEITLVKNFQENLDVTPMLLDETQWVKLCSIACYIDPTLTQSKYLCGKYTNTTTGSTECQVIDKASGNIIQSIAVEYNETVVSGVFGTNDQLFIYKIYSHDEMGGGPHTVLDSAAILSLDRTPLFTFQISKYISWETYQQFYYYIYPYEGSIYLLEKSTIDYSTTNCSLYRVGQFTNLDTPTAPARTSNARKVVENGQMYIILDGVKYAVTGTEL